MILRRLLSYYIFLLLPFAVLTEDVVEDDGDLGSSMQVCSDVDIEVTALSLLCDSPGTFYYGSGKYRNNPYCKSGDKAKLTVGFEIVGDLSEIDPLLTLTAKGDGETVTIYKNARLCYLGTLHSSSGVSCGGYGNFTVDTQFYWTNDDDTTYQSFAPYISVGFHSERDPDKYDLGGANTDMCAGGSFTTWSDDINQSNRFSGPIASIVWSALVLIGTLVVLGMFALYLWRRPAREPTFTQPAPPTDTFARYYEESVDYDRKIVLIRNNSGLVDF